MEFRVPELGEGIEQATVVRVLVAPGASVQEGQDVVEVETEKSTMPIPAAGAGVIDRILVKSGDKVKIGSVLMTTTGPGAATVAAPTPPLSSPVSIPQRGPTENGTPASKAEQRFEFTLPNLGEGITGGTIVSLLANVGDRVEIEQPILELETEKASIPVPSPVAGQIAELLVKPGQNVKVGAVLAVLSVSGAPVKVAASVPVAATVATMTAPTPAAPMSHSAPLSLDRNGDSALPVPASPATRRLARELGVDLHSVIGTAPGGRVTLDDLKAFVRALPKSPGNASGGVASVTSVPPLPDFAKYGPIEKKAFTGLRKAIARNLTLSWNVAPQVTQHDLADITELEASRKSFVDALPKGTPKVTMTVLAIKACIGALKAFPQFNASYDPNAGENGELIVKKYYHVGIAVDTERGLVVPVIRDADRKSIGDLAKELSELADKARNGKLMPDEMRGGTFTITNLGGIGGTAFSPIVNYPEVAILGLSRSSWQPIVRDGKIEPRLMLPLSLTYDHRVVDGADGARFCARLATMFSDPMRMLFES